MGEERLYVLLLNALDIISDLKAFDSDEAFKEYIVRELGLSEEEYHKLVEQYL